MGSGGGSNTVTKSDPWSGAQPYLKDIMGQAQSLYQTGGPQYYPGSSFVGPTPGQLAGWDQTLNYADSVFGNQQAPKFGQATGALSSMLSGTPDYSAVNASTGAAHQQVMNQFTNSFIPQMNAKASYLNNPTGAIKDTNWAMANLGQNMDLNTQQAYLGEYNRAKSAQATGLGYFPSITQAGAIPGELSQQYGDWGANFENQALQDQINRYNYGQQAPYQNLQRYAGIVNGNGGLGGMSQSSASYDPSTAQNVETGLGAAASIYAMYMLGAFSDRRLKTDITKVGQLDSGLAVYRYRFKGDSVYHLGVMADEVRDKFPDAVVRGPDGFDRVFYGELS